MNIDPLTDYETEEIFELLAKTLNISLHSCKKLYAELPPETWLDRKMDISEYKKKMDKCCCNGCGDVIVEFSKIVFGKIKLFVIIVGIRIEEKGNSMWSEIKNYKKIVCCICNKLQRTKGERYHYDHLNMFDKNDSICCMVDRKRYKRYLF